MPSAQPPVENGAGPPKSELEELQIKANTVTDEVSTCGCKSCWHSAVSLLERCDVIILTCSTFLRIIQSLESTRRMLALCEEVSGVTTINHDGFSKWFRYSVILCFSIYPSIMYFSFSFTVHFSRVECIISCTEN